MARRWRLPLALALAAAPVLRAAHLEGELPAESDFAIYAGKFCYDFTRDGWVGDVVPGEGNQESIVGRIAVKVKTLGPVPAGNAGKLFFMVFDDEKQHWKTSRRKFASSTCEEKKAQASLVQSFSIDPATHSDDYSIVIRQHLRPRFWYFTFVACGMSAPIPIRYEIHATNDMHGWEKEVSLDHMGLYRVYEFFTLAFLVSGLVTAWATRWRASAQDPPLKEHPYIQLLTLAYLASGISCALSLIHYRMMVGDGYGSLRLRFLAVFAGVVANCTIYLIAILASSGWAITTASLPGRRVLLGLICVVGCVHAWAELQAELAVDDSTQLYSYQGSMGELSLILKLFIFCWFAFQVKSSYDDELHEKKRRFYKFFGISLGAWAVNIPVTVILAFLINPWWRYKVVVAVDIGARFLGLCLLSQLLCGPLSPISAENTFSLASTHESAYG